MIMDVHERIYWHSLTSETRKVLCQKYLFDRLTHQSKSVLLYFLFLSFVWENFIAKSDLSYSFKINKMTEIN